MCTFRCIISIEFVCAFGKMCQKKIVVFSIRILSDSLLRKLIKYRRLPYSYTKLSYLYTNFIASFLRPHGNLIKIVLIQNEANTQGYNLFKQRRPQTSQLSHKVSQSVKQTHSNSYIIVALKSGALPAFSALMQAAQPALVYEQSKKLLLKRKFTLSHISCKIVVNQLNF